MVEQVILYNWESNNMIAAASSLLDSLINVMEYLDGLSYVLAKKKCMHDNRLG